MDTKLLRIADVAERLGVSNNTAYTMAQEGTVPAFKIAGSSFQARATS